MAKFRKRIKIAPGVTVNVSKSGVSGTFGAKGASVNVGKNGAFLNTGIPGTGIYDRKKLGGGTGAEPAAEYETGEPEQIEDARFSTPEGIAKQKKRRAVFGVFSIAFFGVAVLLFITGHWIWGILLTLTFLIILGTYAGLDKNIKKAEADQSAGESAPEEKEN